MERRKVFVSTSFRNCQLNNYLTAQIGMFAGRNDCEVVDDPEASEYIVLTTCGFDQPREDHSRSMVADYAKRFPGKKVIVSGCLPGIAPRFHEGLDNVVAINTDKLDQFDRMFDAQVPIATIKPNVIQDVPKNGPKGLFNIEISKGCSNRCTFCIIWKTKGRLNSKPIDDIVSEVEEGIRQGYDRFCLLSDNCALYGVDLKVDLADLLNRLGEIEGDFKVMLYYAHPQQFAPLYPKISPEAMARVCYLDLPFQSASKAVLDAMQRNYHPDEVIRLANRIKREHPDLVLATHFLIGFPGETMDEFWATLSASSYFDQVTFFPYTDRPGTHAEEMSGKLSQNDMDVRVSIAQRFVAGNPRMQVMPASPD